jgi:hypothetical protein
MEGLVMAEDDEGKKETHAVVSSSGTKRGKAKVEIKVELDLDDLETFDLRGEGIKITHVVSN